MARDAGCRRGWGKGSWCRSWPNSRGVLTVAQKKIKEGVDAHSELGVAFYFSPPEQFVGPPVP